MLTCWMAKKTASISLRAKPGIPSWVRERTPWSWKVNHAPQRKTPWRPPNLDWFQAFPFQQFHVLFTLSSEYFSSFPHGTCSLSVSHPYLALDEIYHPFWAAIPNSPTLGKECFYCGQFRRIMDGILTLYDISSQRICTQLTAPSATLSWNYNSTRDVTPGRFQNWAFPASLAVTKGILVSFFSSAYLYA